mmetsp:Transcript_60320/g.179198  ORF Transcript_60320/g.179198 Transcript_60320/m.179198 type:complete len:202 (+) Transcript_60320:218-823(+)
MSVENLANSADSRPSASSAHLAALAFHRAASAPSPSSAHSFDTASSAPHARAACTAPSSSSSLNRSSASATPSDWSRCCSARSLRWPAALRGSAPDAISARIASAARVGSAAARVCSSRRCSRSRLASLVASASPTRLHATQPHVKPNPARRASRRAARGRSSVGRYEMVSSSPLSMSRSAYSVCAPSAAFQLQWRLGLQE